MKRPAFTASHSLYIRECREARRQREQPVSFCALSFPRTGNRKQLWQQEWLLPLTLLARRENPDEHCLFSGRPYQATPTFRIYGLFSFSGRSWPFEVPCVISVLGVAVGF
ncbi:hypothetical protein MRX96_050049 [Rhipicephalus microplus]